jgi:uncharacterized protein
MFPEPWHKREDRMPGDFPSPKEVFSRLVDGISRLIDGDVSQVNALTGLYAEPTHVTFPMAHNVAAQTSRAEVRKYFAEAGALVHGMCFRAEEILIHHTADPEVIVAEFVYRGSAPAGALAARSVCVLRVRNGLIVESRNYIDHAAFARARGDALASG